eukprot:989017-Pleurochrysis_carterae.AAC.1
MTYDCVSMPETYMTRLNSRLASGDYLPICFQTYVDSESSSTNTSTHTQQYNLASSSVNKVYCVLRNASYSSAPTKPVSFESDAHAQEGVVSSYYAFKSFESTPDTDSLQYSFRLNSVQHPQFKAGTSTALIIIAGMSHGGTLVSSRGAFEKAY